MDFNDAYKQPYSSFGTIDDIKDFKIRSLENTVNCLEHMMKQKNDEISELKRKIDTIMKVFLGN